MLEGLKSDGYIIALATCKPEICSKNIRVL